MRKFSVNAWTELRGQFCVVKVDLDWLRGWEAGGFGGWFYVSVGLLGFCASLTYYPNGVEPINAGGTD